MRAGLVIGAGVAAAVAGAAVATKSAQGRAHRIQTAADPYPDDVLRRDPVGEECVVERPDGTRIRVVVAGDGPTVVLAHGFAVTMVEWNLVWDDLLGRGYRVVAFDQRGHGQSTIGEDGIGSLPMAGDYLAVFEALGIDTAVLVGHSMGGFLAIAAMLDVPGFAQRVSGLVLFATFSGDITRDAPQNKVQIPLLRSGLLQKAVTNDTVGTLFGASLMGETPSPAMVRVFLETFRAQDHVALLPILVAFAEEDRADRLGEIAVPTIVICGRMDKTTPPWQSERLAAAIPGARMTWVEGAGHMVNWEAPDSLVAAVEALSPVARPG
ncbi:MAG: alpha/beta hydrolase [Actinomycetota bacterium]|nr:alpha/beta hydrolase [Actinomycetota bacterium]